jgi:hypothetical protein
MAKEIDRLRREIRTLRRHIELLEKRFTRDILTNALFQRGLTIFRKNPIHSLIFPPTLTLHEIEQFYRKMKRYSFRLLLRDVIAHQDSFKARDLTRYCSIQTSRRYIRFLSDLDIVGASDRGTYHLKRGPLYSFGGTLEWFVAQVFVREFHCPTIYGVKFRQTTHGGDYDVIALLGNQLVYAEVKSSPPKGIDVEEVKSFLGRIEDLSPQLALFLVDTELRMKDKIVPLFEEALKGSYPVIRLVQELFHVNHRVFIVNSKKDIVSNIRQCLRDYHISQSLFAWNRDGNSGYI